MTCKEREERQVGREGIEGGGRNATFLNVRRFCCSGSLGDCVPTEINFSSRAVFAFIPNKFAVKVLGTYSNDTQILILKTTKYNLNTHAANFINRLKSLRIQY
jgi:hypothetical protein